MARMAFTPAGFGEVQRREKQKLTLHRYGDVHYLLEIAVGRAGPSPRLRKSGIVADKTIAYERGARLAVQATRIAPPLVAVGGWVKGQPWPMIWPRYRTHQRGWNVEKSFYSRMATSRNLAP